MIDHLLEDVEIEQWQMPPVLMEELPPGLIEDEL